MLASTASTVTCVTLGKALRELPKCGRDAVARAAPVSKEVDHDVGPSDPAPVLQDAHQLRPTPPRSGAARNPAGAAPAGPPLAVPCPAGCPCASMNTPGRFLPPPGQGVGPHPPSAGPRASCRCSSASFSAPARQKKIPNGKLRALNPEPQCKTKRRPRVDGHRRRPHHLGHQGGGPQAEAGLPVTAPSPELTHSLTRLPKRKENFRDRDTALD